MISSIRLGFRRGPTRIQAGRMHHGPVRATKCRALDPTHTRLIHQRSRRTSTMSGTSSIPLIGRKGIRTGMRTRERIHRFDLLCQFIVTHFRSGPRRIGQGRRRGWMKRSGIGGLGLRSRTAHRFGWHFNFARGRTQRLRTRRGRKRGGRRCRTRTGGGYFRRTGERRRFRWDAGKSSVGYRRRFREDRRGRHGSIAPRMIRFLSINLGLFFRTVFRG